MCPSRGESKESIEDLKGLFPPQRLKKKKYIIKIQGGKH